MKKRTLFALYPRGLRSGGPEALHQLVSTVRELGGNAYLVPTNLTLEKERVPSYERYDAPEKQVAADSEESVVVAPETMIRELRSFRRAVRACWWLSIDNARVFRSERRLADVWDDYGQLRRASAARRAQTRVLDAALHLRGDFREIGSMLHLVQSSFARDYLYDRTGQVGMPLSDWTPEAGAPTFGAVPRTVVSFNPAKARFVTSKVAEKLPSVQFVGIERMTTEQVRTTLLQSKVYLDLGFHPGKDRMPREAALLGAVTVVAARGAGLNSLDYSIPAADRISASGDLVERSAERVREIYEDSHAAYAGQEGFRQLIRAERIVFQDEVAAIMTTLGL